MLRLWQHQACTCSSRSGPCRTPNARGKCGNASRAPCWSGLCNSPSSWFSITCLLLPLIMGSVLIPGLPQGLFSAQEQPKGRNKDVFGGSLSLTVRAKQEQHPRSKDSHMLLFHLSPNTAHIPRLPQRIPVSAFPPRQPRHPFPAGFTLGIPSIQRRLLFPPRLRQRRSHTPSTHTRHRARPRSQNSHQGSAVVSNPTLWFALSHSGARSTSRCLRAAAAVPENPPRQGSGRWAPAL